MDKTYLGGILKRTPAQPRPVDNSAGGVEEWRSGGGETELFVESRGDCGRLFTWGGLALLLRGPVRLASASGPPDVERVAEEVRGHYLEYGELPVDDLEGSFTLALLDGPSRRVLLYRNLVGAGFTYYHAGRAGLLFGSNLADLVDAAGVAPRPNHAALPTFFLYRFVPGRETLFEDFYRLLPGEQVSWDADGLTRVQRHTFAHLLGPRVPAGEALEGLEATLGAVLADYAALRPGTANLLSGGVDSSYLQAVWNRVSAGTDGEELPRSFSVSVDHPRTWQDTDYAVTASQALGTRHVLVPADGPYADYLLDTLSSTGEPPNHVQTAYFGHLARTMVGRGSATGLCGEGADSLFGLGLANQVHYASRLRRLLPGALLRRALGAAAGVLGAGRVRDVCRLSGRLDDFTDLEHPVNRVAAFTDWEAVRACFGPAAVAGAAAGRRALLDHYAIPETPLDRLHAAGYLGEAADSASLWTTLFNYAGGDLLCPFLDSRLLRFVVNLAPEARYRFRRPKDLIKQALARQAPPELAARGKLGFGQPVFEWLAPGGQLRPLVGDLGRHPFVDGPTLARSLAAPNWFLSSLLCYDLWHQLFIERSLPRPARRPPVWRTEAARLASIG
jgi:asparagine synthase (glutamine-hydrolysing)